MIYVITKKIHQFTYYISTVEFIAGKYFYTWTGMTHNTSKFKRDDVDKYLDDLRFQFPNDTFDFKQA